MLLFVGVDKHAREQIENLSPSMSAVSCELDEALFLVNSKRFTGMLIDIRGEGTAELQLLRSIKCSLSIVAVISRDLKSLSPTLVNTGVTRVF